jgi:hypothetical protein
MSRYQIIRRRVMVARDKQHFAWGRRLTDGCAQMLAKVDGGFTDVEIRQWVRLVNRWGVARCAPIVLKNVKE